MKGCTCEVEKNLEYVYLVGADVGVVFTTIADSDTRADLWLVDGTKLECELRKIDPERERSGCRCTGTYARDTDIWDGPLAVCDARSDCDCIRYDQSVDPCVVECS